MCVSVCVGVLLGGCWCVCVGLDVRVLVCVWKTWEKGDGKKKEDERKIEERTGRKR